MAGSSASSRRPVANPTASGTHSASTARAIVAHGTGAFLGRITSASHSGTTVRAPLTSRAPLPLHTRSKARDKRQRALTPNEGMLPASPHTVSLEGGAGVGSRTVYFPSCPPGGRVASGRKMAMKILLRILVTAVALAIAAWVVPGIKLTAWTLHGTSAISNDASIAKTLIIVAVIFGLINAVIKPVIKAVGCAFYVLTLGLIAIVVNGALLYLTSYIVYDKLHQPFHVTTFLGAVEGALIVGVVTWVAHLILRDED